MPVAQRDVAAPLPEVEYQIARAALQPGQIEQPVASVQLVGVARAASQLVSIEQLVGAAQAL